ncbi:MAG: hypothetical protein K6C94_02980 [Candidatus Gastranaerophilales bacterium]|nr:hypothetical protein [Candidatus Gastranaerophilales bacterium]
MTQDFSNPENKKKEKKMKKQIKKSNNSNKPVSVKLQSDMIELLGILYSTGTKTVEELKTIMTKSRSTIFRLLRGVICYEALVAKQDEITFYTKLKFANRLSESAIFRAFNADRRTPLVFIFLMSVLRKEQGSFVRLSEIAEWLGCDEKEAVRMRNLVLKCTGFGEFEIPADDPWWSEED